MALYLRNSLIMCGLTVASQIVFPTLAGYMLSRTGARSGGPRTCTVGTGSR